MNLKTGPCHAGWCEGKRPKDCRGVPAPTCKLWLTCPCDCHRLVTKMFAMAEEPRRLLDNPEYVRPERTYFMPDRQEVLAQALERELIHAEKVRAERSDVPDTLMREFQPTESGRAGRGELEQNVKLACDSWVALDDPDTDCTTLWVSEWIMREKKLDPSRGAIHAVWKRWHEINFAFVMHNPTRFLCYTPDGIKYGLEEMKARAKRRSKILT